MLEKIKEVFCKDLKTEINISTLYELLIMNGFASTDSPESTEAYDEINSLIPNSVESNLRGDLNDSIEIYAMSKRKEGFIDGFKVAMSLLKEVIN